MAKQHKKNSTPSDLSKNKFAEIILTISHRFSLFTVFDDFLTMSMAACTQNVATHKSWYEDEYLAAIEKYKDSDLRHEFSKAFAALISEMEERATSSLGNDILGEFFEEHISNGRNGQFFTPFPVCELMASITHTDLTVDNNEEVKEPLRILDPCCGSGRMLLASRKLHGARQEYYGIDVDHTCVKMTALNLFMHGAWHSEVMCANALDPDDFVTAYRISCLPLGIFKIDSKEKSKLWHLHNNSFLARQEEQRSASIQLSKTPFNKRKKDDSSQLDLF
ncbi:MAG: N-6 DNA methylase [Ferruginibacter sp.]